MFQVGNQVLYGMHGVCTIIDVEERVIDHKKIQYFVLEPTEQQGTRRDIMYRPGIKPLFPSCGAS